MTKRQVSPEEVKASWAQITEKITKVSVSAVSST